MFHHHICYITYEITYIVKQSQETITKPVQNIQNNDKMI